MMCGLEMLALTRRDKRNRIRNEYMRETAQAEWFGHKVREARLSCFGHVQRRDSANGADRQEEKKIPQRPHP